MNVTADKLRLEQLRLQVQQLEAKLEQEDIPPSRTWQLKGHYTAYLATTGFMLGGVAAMSSLLLNIVGALAFGKDPLELIRVYLTFPMGAQALDFDAVDNGLILAIGVCLYVATGMLYGILFQVILERFTARSPRATRFAVATALALLIWVVNFYAVLSWLQPLLFGGSWIVDEIPPWVAAATHLVFGWTMFVLYPLGLYQPYQTVTESS